MSETSPSPSTSERIKNALRAAQTKLAAAERARREPIAIVAMACRFPGGADNPAALWRKLRAGADMTRDYPAAERGLSAHLFSGEPGTPGAIYTRRGGFLDRVDLFDAEAFHLSPREAEAIDPQQRLVLEVAREALFQANLEPDRLRGGNTGVFVGMGQNDFARTRFHAGDLQAVDAYDGTGNLSCFASGRLGFYLGVQGPNLVVDTACSSSLVALHLACQSLRAGECDRALAGGVHVALSPEVFVFLCRTNALSPKGVCRAFDAGADGFVRGEGCGMLLLKRLSDAERDGDTILATIRGSAVNHDGPSGGLTVPNEGAQEQLVRQALARAKIEPAQVSYLEAHGTGTALGDPIEVSALTSVFAKDRTDPLYLASVKTNMGHLESAAGIAGVIKTVLMMQHGLLVPHLHFQTPSPAINWDALPFQIPTTLQAWQNPEKIAGVSSFGMSGTNAHIVLQGPTTPTPAHAVLREDGYPFKRGRYWPAPPPPRVGNQGPTHPLVGRRLNLPMNDEIRFELLMDPAHQRYLADHLVFGRLVVPGANHLAMILSAVEQVHPQRPPHLRNVLFQQALVLEGPRLVQVLLRPEGDNYQVTLLSRPADQPTAPWIQHMTAYAVAEIPIPPTAPDPQTVRDASRGRRAGAELYADLAGAGFDLGPHFQWNRHYHQSQDSVLCDLAVPANIEADASMLIHPGLLDSCFQLLSCFWPHPPEELAGEDFLYVPFRIAELCMHQVADTHEPLWCYGHHGENNQLLMCNQAGETLVSVGGFAFRRAERANLFAAGTTAPDLLYQFSHHPQVARVETRPDTRYLVFGDNNTVAAALIEQAAGQGAQVLHVGANFGYGAPGPNEINLNPFNSDNFERLFEKHPPSQFDGLFLLWDLQTTTPKEREGFTGTHEPNGEDMLNSELDAAEVVLNLLKAMLQSGATRLPKILIATQAGLLHDFGTTMVPHNAVVWGLARSAALEFDKLSLVTCDLSPMPAPQQARYLLDEMRNTDGEDQVLFTETQRLVPRLQAVQVNPEVPVRIKREGTYLITGAYGGLGLLLTEWLAAQGARHVMLAARRPVDAAGRKRLDRLRDQGVTIHSQLGDIGHHAVVNDLLTEIRTHMPPLAGVFHVAGTTDDGGLLQQTRNTLDTVFWPKVAASWHLHQQTQVDDLDYFVCFSSSAAVLGSRGQSNYAAANAFLDALAAYRRQRGLPATSINWGAWREAGMASRLSADQQKKLADQGVGSFSPQQGFQALAHLLDEQETRALVGAYDPNLLAQAFFNGRPPRLLSELDQQQAPAPTVAVKTVSLLDQLKAAEPGARTTMLARFLRSHIAGVLKLKSPEQLKPRQRLFDIGLDSIMAMELQRSLETTLDVSLRATLIFDFPTLEALQQHLLETLGLNAPATSQAAPESASGVQQEIDPFLAEIRRMSPGELLGKLTLGTKP